MCTVVYNVDLCVYSKCLCVNDCVCVHMCSSLKYWVCVCVCLFVCVSAGRLFASGGFDKK